MSEARWLQRDVGSWNDVTGGEAQNVVDALERLKAQRATS